MRVLDGRARTVREKGESQMKSDHSHWSFVRTLVLGSTLVAGQAHAAGFFLPYQGASAVGNSLAGSAALGEDASTVYFNPAGMSRLETGQVSVAGHYVDPSFRYADTGSTGPLPGTTGGNGGSFAPASALPALFAVMPVGNWRFGLGVSAPFGSQTDYDAGWRGRFQADLTEIRTINVNPSFSYRLNDRWSAGFGINYLTLDAKIERSTLVPPPLVGALQEGRASLDGKDHAFGFNAGVLWEPASSTRVGVSYRSRVDLELTGRQAVLDASGGTVAPLGFDIKADLTLPATTQVSVVHALDQRWTLLGDVSFYQWSSVQSLVVRNSATGAVSSTLDLKFRDTKRLSAAVNYRLCDNWLLRAGLAWDQSVTGSAVDRTANQPDSDRTWLSLGARWDLGPRHRVDLAYAHVWLAPASIAHPVANAGTLRGNYDNSADILAAQYSFSW